jgi:predicted transcriptional regulator
LATRFEVPLDQFDAILAGYDLEALTQLSQIAFEASTLAEFEAGLAEATTGQINEEDDVAGPQN